RSDAAGDARSVGPGDRYRACAFRRLHSDGVSSRDYRTFVPTIRSNDSDLRHLIRVQRAFAQSGTVIVIAAAAKENARPARLVLRSVQSCIRPRDSCLRKLVAPGHSKSRAQFRIAGRVRSRCGPVWIAIAEWIPTGRRSRLRLSRAAVTRRIVTRTYRDRKI